MHKKNTSNLCTRAGQHYRIFNDFLPACVAVVLLACASTSFAQTTTALQDTTCIGARSGNLTCSANEFAVLPSFSAAPGSPGFCTAGDQLNLNVSIQLSGSNTNRYDIGFFTGQIGNDPRSNTAGNICSAAVVPPASFPGGINPWFDSDGDTCGDLRETTPPPATDSVTWTVQNVKVLCQGGTTSALAVPYVLSYDQSSTFLASCSAANVTNGAPSKCNSGTAEVTVGVTPLRVGGYVDITKQTRPDADTQSFLYTASGPAGTFLGYSINGGTITSVGDNTIDAADNVSITDGQILRVYMSVTASTQTLTITEQAGGQPTHWENNAAISCANVTGTPNAVGNNVTRVITAPLNTTNSAAACTVTNTKRARLSLIKNVIRRIAAADQFTVSVSGAGSTTLTNTSGVAIPASAVTVTTSGAATGNYTNATNPTFRVTPDQSLLISDAMAAGSTTALSMHESLLTCTNAFAGSGATTSLPNNLATTTFNLIPAPDDNITCTFSNKGRLSDLSISKTNGVAALASGSSTSYTIRATNNGPDTVTGALLSDPAAAGLTVTAIVCSATPGQCTPASTPSILQLQTGNFPLPVLAVGQFYELLVTVTTVATGF